MKLVYYFFSNPADRQTQAITELPKQCPSRLVLKHI